MTCIMRTGGDCLKSHCAWWISKDQCCAVVSIAISLNDKK